MSTPRALLASLNNFTGDESNLNRRQLEDEVRSVHNWKPMQEVVLSYEVNNNTLAPLKYKYMNPMLLDIITKNGSQPLKAHQRLCLNFLLQARGLVAAHGTGTGKTKLAAAFAFIMLYHVPDVTIYILTPASLQLNVMDEMRSMWKTVMRYVGSNNLQFYTFDKFYRDYDSGKIKPKSKRVLIVDEAHNLRSVDGKKYKIIEQFARSAYKVLLLTATPVPNHPRDVFPLIGMVDGEKPLNPKFDIFEDLNENGMKCLLLNKFHVYHPESNKARAMFPTVHETPVTLTMSQSFYEKYRLLEQKKWDAWLKQHPNGKSKGGNLEMFLSGLRQSINALEQSESPKVTWIMKKLLSRKQDQKFVIFSNWKVAGIYLLEQECKQHDIKYRKVTGDQSKNERAEAVRRYNRGKVKVLFISRAGGEGLDLKGTTDVILLEPSWNEAAEIQIIGRAARYQSHTHLPEGDRKVNVTRLILRKPDKRLPGDNDPFSVDQRVTNILHKKKALCDKLMENIKKYSITSKFKDQFCEE